MIYLNDWLPGTTLKALTDRKLSDAEVLLVKKNIEALNPDKAITTSSCFITALAPYQISEMLTEYLSLDNNFIYNGDFLHDLLNNPFWVSIKGDWAAHVSLLVAMAKEQELVKQINPQLTCYVVGSSAIDKLYVEEKAATPKAEELRQLACAARLAEIKRQLNAPNYILFISGSKTVDDDLDLLRTLDLNMIIANTTSIRMGLHPGTQDMQDYVKKVIEWLQENKEFPAQLIITKVIKSKMTDLSILTPGNVCEVDLSGDDIFPVANAVASAQPTTLASQAVISGIPAFCLPGYSNSYLLPFFKHSPEELIQADSKKPTMLTKTEMGLPDERAVDLVSDKLLTEYSNRRRR